MEANNGYTFVQVRGVSDILGSFRKCDFDKEIPPASYIEGRQPRMASSAGAYQRDSWFLSPQYVGPFGDLVGDFLKMLEDPIEEFISRRGLDKVYPRNRYSLGVHRYLPSNDEVQDPAAVKYVSGLPAHYDVDILTLLATDGPLEGFINGEWVAIEVPHDHVMVFTGLTTTAATGERPLLHRVPLCTKAKFSVGAFIGAAGDLPFVVSDSAPAGLQKFKTGDVDTFQRAYFSGGVELDL